MPSFNTVNKKESLYECILKNKNFDLDFFQDSSTDEDEGVNRKDSNVEDDENEDSSGPEEVSKAFKFNQDHCLFVFNTIKQGGAANSNN